MSIRMVIWAKLNHEAWYNLTYDRRQTNGLDTVKIPVNNSIAKGLTWAVVQSTVSRKSCSSSESSGRLLSPGALRPSKLFPHFPCSLILHAHRHPSQLVPSGPHAELLTLWRLIRRGPRFPPHLVPLILQADSTTPSTLGELSSDNFYFYCIIVLLYPTCFYNYFAEVYLCTPTPYLCETYF